MSKTIRLAAKKLLRGILGRDFIILNSNWQRLGGWGNAIIIGEDPRPESVELLPVAYNYHIPPSGRLSYSIMGSGAGTLEYTLYCPAGVQVCQASFEVVLPFRLEVTICDTQIVANDKRIASIGLDLLNPPALEVSSELLLRRADRTKSWRRTGHRIRLALEETNESYFSGRHYCDYALESRVRWLETHLRVVEEFHDLHGKFLDVGCATGLLVRKAFELGLDAYGIDYCSWAIKTAQSHIGDRCWHLDIDTAEPDQIGVDYDIITMISVLEHTKDPEGVLRKIFQACALGGIVYVYTLNADSMLARITGDDWTGLTDYTHFSSWITWLWLVETAEAIGFQVESVETSGLWIENQFDPVWNGIRSLFSTEPVSTLLADGFGDFVRVVLRKQ